MIDALEIDEEAFEQCVETILRASGRVVITGIGKSAIIGQKIVATLNSTGTPALFMHAADAIHGDLGMITDLDVVLALSYSGESDEILTLLDQLNRDLKLTIVLITHQMEVGMSNSLVEQMLADAVESICRTLASWAVMELRCAAAARSTPS